MSNPAPPAASGSKWSSFFDLGSGRGLILVDALANVWGVDPRLTAPGKTLWAELCLPSARTAPS